MEWAYKQSIHTADSMKPLSEITHWGALLCRRVSLKPRNLWNLETTVIMIEIGILREVRACVRSDYASPLCHYRRELYFTSKYSGFKVSGFQFLLCIGISQFCWNLPMVSEGLFETKWLTKKALHRLSEWGRPRRTSLCISVYSISVDSEGKWIV